MAFIHHIIIVVNPPLSLHAPSLLLRDLNTTSLFHVLLSIRSTVLLFFIVPQNWLWSEILMSFKILAVKHTFLFMRMHHQGGWRLKSISSCCSTQNCHLSRSYCSLSCPVMVVHDCPWPTARLLSWWVHVLYDTPSQHSYRYYRTIHLLAS